ncbi:MAG: hypothetical protein V3T06_03530, partial [Dehalococcoidia bacterium]
MSKLKYIVIAVLLIIGITLVVTDTLPNSTTFASEYLGIDEELGSELTTQELVAQVAPAVVSIVTETVTYNWFWQAVPQTGAGSGIAISSD